MSYLVCSNANSMPIFLEFESDTNEGLDIAPSSTHLRWRKIGPGIAVGNHVKVGSSLTIRTMFSGFIFWTWDEILRNIMEV